MPIELWLIGVKVVEQRKNLKPAALPVRAGITIRPRPNAKIGNEKVAYAAFESWDCSVGLPT